MLFELQDKELCDLYVDAIICPVDRFLNMRARVAERIKERGGNVIQKEAKKRGIIPDGEAVVTTSGALLSTFVIHGAVYDKNLRITEHRVYDFILNTLRRAEEMDLESVGFPILGEFTRPGYVQVISDALEAFLHESEGKVNKIVFSSDNSREKMRFEKIFKGKNIC